MSNTAESRKRGPEEDEARHAAGVDDLQVQRGDSGGTSAGVEPASAVGSPPASNDVEQIHEELRGFADAIETPTEGDPGTGSEDG